MSETNKKETIAEVWFQLLEVFFENGYKSIPPMNHKPDSTYPIVFLTEKNRTYNLICVPESRIAVEEITPDKKIRKICTFKLCKCKQSFIYKAKIHKTNTSKEEFLRYLSIELRFFVHYAKRVDGKASDDMYLAVFKINATDEEILSHFQDMADKENVEIFDIQYFDGRDQKFLDVDLKPNCENKINL